MLNTYLNQISENSGDTSATTFFHEILCGIFIYYPEMDFATGADIKQYFDMGKIVPINASLTPVSIEDLNQKRFLSEEHIISPKIIADAKNIARAFREKIKLSGFSVIKKILWAGPTNDGSIYGAADIVVVMHDNTVYPISLKFGAGQLKNLSINTIGELIGIALTDSDNNTVAQIIDNYRSVWDKLTNDWIKFINSQLKINHPKAVQLFKKVSYDVRSWENFNNRPDKIEDIDELYKACDLKISTSPKYKHLRKFCAKYYETYLDRSGASEWTQKIRKAGFENSIGAFFKSKENYFKRNGKILLGAQLSIQEEDFWYIAKGGKDLKLIPGQKRFEAGLKNFIIDYDFETSGTGFIIPLRVRKKRSNELLLEIKIFFRWVQGQMFGNLTTTSSKKEFVDDWTEFFI